MWLQALEAVLQMAEGARGNNSKPVDRPSDQTVEVRQGTGPRAMVSVLLVSLLIAAVAGVLLLAYFYLNSTASPP
jgi:hypothetical protein